MKHKEIILILDFGSQYTQLIARRIREIGVHSEIHPFSVEIELIRALNPKGIILSGSPSSVYEADAPLVSTQLFELGVPILGICYGFQLIGHLLGGKVDSAARREYGYSELLIDCNDDLFADIGNTTSVWMSHGDALLSIPNAFEPIAHSINSPICAIRNQNKKIYGVQFHPEVVHTPQGRNILKNFALKICEAEGGWTPAEFVRCSINEIRNSIGSAQVLCALSGGVDSLVLEIGRAHV